MARYDIFLSYSRADTERVAPLRDALRQLGYRVFFDTQSIDPGEQWKQRLERSIQASRTLVLCWSQNTRGSEYITFEYSRAEALHRRVLPWLLDKTPLPAMLEIQGVTATDPAQAAALLKPALGMPLKRRNALKAALAACVAILAGVALWYFLRPPPPWHFKGQVTDRITAMPIQGVEVDVMSGNQVEKSALTDAQGDFDIALPQPAPKDIQVLYRKDGYEAERPLFLPTDKAWNNMDMAKLP
jgi:TIR domain